MGCEIKQKVTCERKIKSEMKNVKFFSPNLFVPNL